VRIRAKIDAEIAVVVSQAEKTTAETAVIIAQAEKTKVEMNLLELKAEADKARAEKEFREVMVWLLVCALVWSIA
jgi:hypothetical protein